MVLAACDLSSLLRSSPSLALSSKSSMRSSEAMLSWPDKVSTLMALLVLVLLLRLTRSVHGGSCSLMGLWWEDEVGHLLRRSSSIRFRCRGEKVVGLLAQSSFSLRPSTLSAKSFVSVGTVLVVVV